MSKTDPTKKPGWIQMLRMVNCVCIRLFGKGLLHIDTLIWIINQFNSMLYILSVIYIRLKPHTWFVMQIHFNRKVLRYQWVIRSPKSKDTIAKKCQKVKPSSTKHYTESLRLNKASLTKNRGWTRVLRNGKQCLLCWWQPSCISSTCMIDNIFQTIYITFSWVWSTCWRLGCRDKWRQPVHRGQHGDAIQIHTDSHAGSRRRS